MWTPTDHWLEITIETLGRREGGMAGSGRTDGREISASLRPYTVALLPIFSIIFLTRLPRDETFREEEGVVIRQTRLLIRFGEICQINLSGAEP